MKWFKHVVKAYDDELLAAIIEEFGVAGYGIWWIMIEHIIANFENDKNSISLTYPLSTWAQYCHISQNKFIKFCEFLDDFVSFKNGSDNREWSKNGANLNSETHNLNSETHNLNSETHNLNSEIQIFEKRGQMKANSRRKYVTVFWPNILKYMEKNMKHRFLEQNFLRKKKSALRKKKSLHYTTLHNNIKEIKEKEKTKSECLKNREKWFDIFWDHYPIKKGKAKAREKFMSLVKTHDLFTTIIQAIENQVRERSLRSNAQLFNPEWKHPIRWLSCQCWQDEVNLEEKNYESGKSQSPDAKCLREALDELEKYS